MKTHKSYLKLEVSHKPNIFFGTYEQRLIDWKNIRSIINSSNTGCSNIDTNSTISRDGGLKEIIVIVKPVVIALVTARPNFFLIVLSWWLTLVGALNINSNTIFHIHIGS